MKPEEVNDVWIDGNKKREIDTSKPGKDTELYVGQKWDLGSVFKNVVDKDGNPIKPEEVNDVWIDGNKKREIDTSKPGEHTVNKRRIKRYRVIRRPEMGLRKCL
ncbi:bacterial Ig-like domain-containing protein [Enterococcus faecalis]|uniref:bacterial Ig-like domain-containing protein n=1 Tax=Enterococcus faecalis TaxID=1351 RepID=UPI003AACEBDA